MKIRYILVGIFGFIIEFGLFSFFMRMNISISKSNFLAFNTALFICFVLHFSYTYQYTISDRKFFFRGFTKFLALMYVQLAFGTVLLWFLIDKIGLLGDLAKLLQIAVVTPLGYLVQKNLIFQETIK
jgi:putative flippase GtrA